jgi:hypothetical protein
MKWFYEGGNNYGRGPGDPREIWMLAFGVDVSVSRDLDLVVLNEQRRLIGPPLRGQTPDDLARLLPEQKPDVVAIDSPPKLGTSNVLHTVRSREGEEQVLRLDGLSRRRRVRATRSLRTMGFAAPRSRCSARQHRRPQGLPAARWHMQARRQKPTAVLEAQGVAVSGLHSTDEIDAALAMLSRGGRATRHSRQKPGLRVESKGERSKGFDNWISPVITEPKIRRGL